MTGILLALAGFCAIAAPEAREFRDWAQMRDSGVIRQQHDFSCGLASLATLLTYYYRVPTTEQQLLDRLLARSSRAAQAALRERGVSFTALAGLAAEVGLPAVGLRVPLAVLGQLRRPVIVYLEQGGQPHFSVLRGADSTGRVLLADPAAGNRRVDRVEFARWFLDDNGDGGRVLLLGPSADADAGYAGYLKRDPVIAPPGRFPLPRFP